MLSNETMVIMYQQGGNEFIFNELLQANEKLIWDTIHSMALIETKVFDSNDYYSIAVGGFLRAVNTYSTERGALFTTYAVTCMRTDLQQALKREQTKGRGGNFHTISYFAPVGDDENTQIKDAVADTNADVPFPVSTLLAKALNSLNEDELTFFNTHYIDGELHTKPRQNTIDTLGLNGVKEFKSIDRKVRIKLASALGVKYDPRDKQTGGIVAKLLN